VQVPNSSFASSSALFRNFKNRNLLRFLCLQEYTLFLRPVHVQHSKNNHFDLQIGLNTIPVFSFYLVLRGPVFLSSANMAVMRSRVAGTTTPLNAGMAKGFTEEWLLGRCNLYSYLLETLFAATRVFKPTVSNAC
jgi:hypothetical protein